MRTVERLTARKEWLLVSLKETQLSAPWVVLSRQRPERDRVEQKRSGVLSTDDLSVADNLVLGLSCSHSSP